MGKSSKQLCEYGEVTGECNEGRVRIGIHEIADSTGRRLVICSDHLLFEYIEDETKEEGRDYELISVDKKALDHYIKSEREKGNYRG